MSAMGGCCYGPLIHESLILRQKQYVTKGRYLASVRLPFKIPLLDAFACCPSSLKVAPITSHWNPTTHRADQTLWTETGLRGTAARHGGGGSAGQCWLIGGFGALEDVFGCGEPWCNRI